MCTCEENDIKTEADGQHEERLQREGMNRARRSVLTLLVSPGGKHEKNHAGGAPWRLVRDICLRKIHRVRRTHEHRGCTPPIIRPRNPRNVGDG